VVAHYLRLERQGKLESLATTPDGVDKMNALRGECRMLKYLAEQGEGGLRDFIIKDMKEKIRDAGNEDIE
jgi:hypothetical protein